MNVNTCASCGVVIPEGRMVCLRCEHTEIKYGMILQTNNATKEEIEKTYAQLQANITITEK